MEVTIESLFELSSKLNIDFVKSNEIYLKYFYLMIPKKTCNCPNKPKIRTQESFDEAYNLYINFNTSLDNNFKNELKIKLNLEKINFKNLNGEIVFSF
jgi:hypothetical protein